MTCCKVCVEEIIKALKALPQCMKANTEATNMSAKTPSGAKKSRSKKECSKQEKPGEEVKASKRSLKLLEDLRFRCNEFACINSGRNEGNPSPSTLD
jgi:hypothetical protein